MISWPHFWLFIFITSIVEPRYKSINAYRLGNEIPNSNVRTYGNGMQPLCVFRKMALFKETEDFNLLSNDIGRVKGKGVATESAQT